MDYPSYILYLNSASIFNYIKNIYIYLSIFRGNDTYQHLFSMPNDLRSRPIVSNINSPTSRLSHFLDAILKPLISQVPGYIKDTYDLLNKLPRTIDYQSYFISLDVISLYTNIPHHLGIEAVEYWLNKYPHLIVNSIPNTFIIEALHLILNNNTFLYDDVFYIQKKGTAMGTKVAPTYAHLTMAYLEVTLFSIYKTKYKIDTENTIMKHYWRFLDDILIIWNPQYGQHQDFINTFQSINTNIQFENTVNENEIHFLDIKLIKQNNYIISDIFYKLTDAKRYLHFYSFHPRHIKRNIPYVLSKRITRIVSDPVLLNQRLRELEITLSRLRYPTNLIKDAINKAINSNISINNKTLIDNKSIIPFVFTYNPISIDIINNKIIPHFTQIDNIFFTSKLKFIKAIRQPPNLLCKLNNSFSYNVFRCRASRCKLCPILIEYKNVINIKNNFLTLNGNINCKTRNLIYVMFCKNCNQIYVGETGTKLNLRMNLHRNHIQNIQYGFLKVSIHIRHCGGEFKVAPIYKMPETSGEFLRKKMEGYFRLLLKPELNSA